MRLYFIRHAQSSNNLLWDQTGTNVGRSCDPEITSAGRRQAELLARFLARRSAEADGVSRFDPYDLRGFGITHLYTSLMLRAVATADAVSRELKLPATASEDLHESGGIYLEDEKTGERTGRAGSNRAFFEQHYPDLILPDACGDTGWWNRPYEEHPQAMERARRFWTGIVERHGGTEDRVALISHGDFYNCLLGLLFQIGGPSVWFRLNNVGITRIDFQNGQTEMIYANRIDFLPADLVT